MQAPILSAVLAVAISGAGGLYVLEYGTTEAHKSNLSNDVSNCRLELTADLSFTGGQRTQAAASTELAACKVAPGTTLTIQMAPDGYDYTVTGTSTDLPGYTATMDTKAGGAIVVTPPAS